MLLIRLAKALQAGNIPYAIVGGYAVALHGLVRGTIDIDLILNFSEKEFIGAEKIFKTLGLEPRLPVNGSQVFHFREDYIENRNLVAWSFYNPKNPIECVDVIITQDCRKVSVQKVLLGDVPVNVISIRDLIKMKTRSGRPQDLADVQSLRKISK